MAHLLTKKYLCTYSLKFREMFEEEIYSDEIQQDDFPVVFLRFIETYQLFKTTVDIMDISLEEYDILYHFFTLWRFEFFLKELEKHYKGTRNIYELSGTGWDLYLPETQDIYIIRNTIPDNLEKVKTNYRLYLKLDRLDQLENWYALNKDSEIPYHIVKLHYPIVEFKLDNSLIIDEISEDLWEKLVNLKYLNFRHRNPQSFQEKVISVDYYKIDLSKQTLLEILILPEIYYDVVDLSKQKLLKKLRIGENYNQMIDLTKQTLLEELIVGNSYNQKLDLTNQTMLRGLTFGDSYNQELDLTNQTRLKLLVLGSHFNQEIDLSNLRDLRTLIFGKYRTKAIDISNQKLLKYLHMGYDFNQPLDVSKLKNIRQIYMSKRFNQPIDLTNMRNLCVLEFGSDFNQPIDLSKQENLEYLYIGVHYNHPLNLSFQKKLKFVIFGNEDRYNCYHVNFNQKITFPVESSLRVVYFRYNDQFNQPLDLSNQRCLEIIRLPEKYSSEITNFKECKSLKIVDVGYNLSGELFKFIRYDLKLVRSLYSKTYWYKSTDKIRGVYIFGKFFN
jgi:hypothetical protein